MNTERQESWRASQNSASPIGEEDYEWELKLYQRVQLHRKKENEKPGMDRIEHRDRKLMLRGET